MDDSQHLDTVLNRAVEDEVVTDGRATHARTQVRAGWAKIRLGPQQFTLFVDRIQEAVCGLGSVLVWQR